MHRQKYRLQHSESHIQSFRELAIRLADSLQEKEFSRLPGTDLCLASLLLDELSVEACEDIQEDHAAHRCDPHAVRSPSLWLPSVTRWHGLPRKSWDLLHG